MFETMDKQFSRRNFLQYSASAAAAMAIMPVISALPTAAANKVSTLSYFDVMKLSPKQMAEKSVVVQDCYRYLLKVANEIKDTSLRSVVIEILKDPVPKVMERYQSFASREELRSKLINNNLLKTSVGVEDILPPALALGSKPQSFDAAPGSGYMSHHSYPGGLVVHTALNVRSALGLYQAYRDSNAVSLDKDLVLAGELLHDLHKPWVFQWKTDGSSLPETTIAGTGAHHILGIAESMYRGLPKAVITAQASAHDNAGSPEDESKLVGYLKAAAMIAGKDIMELGLLEENGESLRLPRRIEPFLVYLGDHDWIFSVPGAKWSIGILQEIARKDYGMTDNDLKNAPFNSLRNYIFSQVTIMGFYQTYASQGEKAVRQLVQELVEVPRA